MTSNDVYVVVNDEQSFRLYVVEQFGKMDARMTRIETRLDGVESRMDKLEARVGNLESGVTALAHQHELIANRLDMGLWFTGICFAVLALVIAFVGIFAPKFWERFTRKESMPAPEIDIDVVADKAAEIIARRYELKPKR